MILTKNLRHIFTYSYFKVTRNKRNVPNSSLGVAFKARYPRATFVRWNQVDVFKWQVNFSLKGKDFSALFNSEGNWLETVALVSLGRIPKTVQESFMQKYNPEGLQQIRHIKTSINDIFEIQWSNGIFVWKLLYDTSGKIVGKLSV